VKCLLNRYNRLFWQVPFLLFFCFISNTVFAQTCEPGQPLTSPIGFYCTGLGCTLEGQLITAPTELLACTLAGSASSSFDFLNVSGNTCNLSRTAGGPDFAININFFAAGCAAGYVDNGNGQCEATCTPENPCEDSGGDSGGEQFWGGSKSGGGCVDGCAIQADSGCISTTSELSGLTVTSCAQTSFTGQACTSEPNVVAGATVKDNIAVPPENDPPQSSQDCSPGTGFAQVNNETMCLPSGTTIDGDQTTTTSDGGTTTESTTTTINPDGTTTTQTDSSFTDSTGNTVTGSTTTQGGINQAGQGESDTPGLGPAPVFDDSPPSDSTFNILNVPNPTLSMDLFSVGASCPAPITFNAMDEDFEITFQPVCDLSDIIRGIILLLSAIVAIRILVSN
jgi:hypothetical protein